jgi:hypothetical protein
MSQEIESIPIREFRENLQKYTTENPVPIAVTSEGTTLGYYIPAPTQGENNNLESLREAVIKLGFLLREKGMTEDDIIVDFQELKKAN